MEYAEVVDSLAVWLERLSPAEALELQLQRIELANHTEEMIFLQVTLYITFVSAYLAAAYVGGSALSRIQALIASTIFAVCSAFAAWNVLGSYWLFEAHNRGIGIHYLAMARTFERPDWLEMGEFYIRSSQSNFFDSVLGGVMVTGILAALYFMWSVRHPKTE